jgi:tRNA-(ms[2]io[6]A)-hydroxylase
VAKPKPLHKLPVIQDSSPEEGDSPRAYAWIAFGTVAIFVVWLPLAWLSAQVAARLSAAWLGPVSSPEEAALAVARLDPSDRLRVEAILFGVHGVGLALASLAGGFLVGRWGGQAGVREAVLSGLAAVGIACALSFTTQGLSWTPLVAVALAAAVAGVGGHIGRKRRPTP